MKRTTCPKRWRFSGTTKGRSAWAQGQPRERRLNHRELRPWKHSSHFLLCCTVFLFPADARCKPEGRWTVAWVYVPIGKGVLCRYICISKGPGVFSPLMQIWNQSVGLQHAGNLGEVLHVETKRGEINTLSGVSGKFLTDKKQNTDLQLMTHGLNFLFLFFFPENKIPAGYFVFFFFSFLIFYQKFTPMSQTKM